MKKLYFEGAEQPWLKQRQADAEVEREAGASGEALEPTCEPMHSDAEAMAAPVRIYPQDACAHTDVYAGVAGAPMARAVKRRR